RGVVSMRHQGSLPRRARQEMPMRSQFFVLMLTVALLATACGAGNGGNENQAGLPGGTLVTAGSRWVQTRDLRAASGWTAQLEYQERFALPTVHLESMKLYMARFRMADPFYVDVHDLQDFAVESPR